MDMEFALPLMPLRALFAVESDKPAVEIPHSFAVPDINARTISTATVFASDQHNELNIDIRLVLIYRTLGFYFK